LIGAERYELVAVRRGIEFIFQSHNPLDFLSARRKVELASLLHPEISNADARRRAEELLELVGLPDRMDHHPAQLSGG